MLNNSPQCPKEIAHGLIHNHPAYIKRIRVMAEVGSEQNVLLLRGEISLDLEVAQIPHGIVIAPILKVDDENLISIVDTVFDHRIAVAGC